MLFRSRDVYSEHVYICRWCYEDFVFETRINGGEPSYVGRRHGQFRTLREEVGLLFLYINVLFCCVLHVPFLFVAILTSDLLTQAMS